MAGGRLALGGTAEVEDDVGYETPLVSASMISLISIDGDVVIVCRGGGRAFWRCGATDIAMDLV